MSGEMIRLATAGGISLLIVLLLGPVVIPVLHRLKFGQEVRDDGPRTHLKKQGTPTMGGVLFIIATGLASLLVAGRRPEIWLLFGVMLASGLIGFTDDLIKIVWKRPLGLKARAKILGQLMVGVLLCWGLYQLGRGTVVSIPLTGIRVNFGFWYYPFIVLVLLAVTNAVNLSDGLDGLAGGLVAMVALAFIVIGWMTGHFDAAVFAGALAGGSLGFLKYNHYPARVFMGDTGSLALGGGLAVLAALTKTEILLIILGGVFAIEVLSVIIQVISFQTTGKRVFKMSPLHHHFELCGWPEVRVVYFFWFLGLCCAVLGLLAMYGLG